MTRKIRRRLIVGALGVLVLVALVLGFLPEAAPVETATVRRAPLQVLVEEEGETHLDDRYVIAAPVGAFLRRVALSVGDSVAEGQAVAYLDPPTASDLDPRSRAEAEARLRSAEAALTRAGEQVRAAEAGAEAAVRERERVERLYEAESATRQGLERAVADAEQAVADREAARAAVAAAQADLTAARAAVREGPGGGSLAPGVLRAPVGGRVLAVHQVSAGPVSAGQPLVEVGDLDALEVRVDVLSEDAVRLGPGTRVLLDQWGGDRLLEATVRRVEPQGFTEVSSLGVEEKRVTVVAGMDSPRAERAGLGVGYRVLARFVVWESDDALQVPSAALFRQGDGWAVFVIEGGRAVRRRVTVGHEGGLATEVLDGLAEGERVVVHPDNALDDGSRVEPAGSEDGS